MRQDMMGFFGMQWHQLDHMQTICTLLQTDNHTNTHHSPIATWKKVLKIDTSKQQTDNLIFKSQVQCQWMDTVNFQS